MKINLRKNIDSLKIYMRITDITEYDDRFRCIDTAYSLLLFKDKENSIRSCDSPALYKYSIYIIGKQREVDTIEVYRRFDNEEILNEKFEMYKKIIKKWSNVLLGHD